MIISPTMPTFKFYLQYIDSEDEDFFQENEFEVKAPHYEAAVATALATGQQVLRDIEKFANKKSIFMRLCT
jgi:hypothetical protein